MDVWQNINDIGLRCSPREDVGNVYTTFPFDLSCGNPSIKGTNLSIDRVEDTVAAIWSPLLARAAAIPTKGDHELCRLYEDAINRDIPSPHEPSEAEVDEKLEAAEPIVRGRARLRALVE